MPFVIIEKNNNIVPGEEIIREAMKETGGRLVSADGTNSSRKVEYTGDVNHTDFENNLIDAVKGARRTSWNFSWAGRSEEDEEGAGAGELSVMGQYHNGNGSGNGHLMPRGLTATEYEVDVVMSAETVNRLQELGFYLHAFKAVQSMTPGAPLVWFTLNPEDYSEKTQITWQVEYEAYTSRSKIIPNGRVSSSFSAHIDLGHTLTVLPNRGGGGDVTAGGPERAISILNKTDVEYVCGISQKVEGKSNPMCAFPLLGGGNKDVIAPIEKILLMFSTSPLNTGTVIYQAYSEGVMIDLTSANTRAVKYEVNKGWSWGGFNWARKVEADENLVPLLIDSPALQILAATPLIETRALVFS